MTRRATLPSCRSWRWITKARRGRRAQAATPRRKRARSGRAQATSPTMWKASRGKQTHLLCISPKRKNTLNLALVADPFHLFKNGFFTFGNLKTRQLVVTVEIRREHTLLSHCLFFSTKSKAKAERAAKPADARAARAAGFDEKAHSCRLSESPDRRDPFMSLGGRTDS